MFRNTLTATAVLMAGLIHAQELPQPSPLGKVEQVVGLTHISVEYSRPSAKGRTIFGELVPYNEVWRTGANGATKLELKYPVRMEGQEVPAGAYSIFTIPGDGAWVFILNKNTELWGEADRKAEEDLLQLKVPVEKCPETETFTIEFADVVDDKAVLTMRWATSMIKINIEADATQQGIANIKEAMAKPDVKFGGYNGSARFCLDRGVMTKEALGWAEKSVALEKKFWNLHTLARAQAANGQMKEAIATAEESMKLAQSENNKAYVEMNRTRIEEWMKSGK